MKQENKKCENCIKYRHTPNIIGGVSECLLDVKLLMSFWANEACDKYQEKDNAPVPDSLMNERLSELTQIIDNQ